MTVVNEIQRRFKTIFEANIVKSQDFRQRFYK